MGKKKVSQQTTKISGHDAPIESAKDDLLDGLGVARAIHRVLSTAPPEWSTRIGLYGPWGSGKTSVLNLLRNLAEADGSMVVSFSAWSAMGEGSVIAQFYKTLADKLRNESIQLPMKQRVKDAATKARPFKALGRLVGIGAEELAPVPPIVTKVATEALSTLASAASGWTKINHKDLETIAILIKGRRVIVFIDDLDRADPRVVPKTLLAMRELLDWPGFSFVLAFDKRAISSALSEYSIAFGDDAEGFLEKVIDVPFEIPDTRDAQLKQLAVSALKTCCAVMPSEAVESVVSMLPRQPRRVKLIARMMGALQQSLARHNADEIDWTGLCLYLIVKEASQSVANWVVDAVTASDSDFVLWASDEKEKEKKEQDTKETLMGLLSAPKAPPDSKRIIAASLRLLRHWDMTSAEAVMYWVELSYREPSITFRELQTLRDKFAEISDASLVDEAIRRTATYADSNEEYAAADCLTVAVASYGMALGAMADARTNDEWQRKYSDAQKSLFLLEHFWTQSRNEALATAASQGGNTLTLLQLVSKWITWTKNEGESNLRQREKTLALAAAAKCVDPESLFAETDPFWNSHFAESKENAETIEAWREILRGSLAPRIVSRLCERLLQTDGLMSVATGDDKLGPWLVENKESPLYIKPELTKQFIATLRSDNGINESARIALAKNARLYLQQILFQTRSSSWGGLDHAKAINAMHPDIIPAAWVAATVVSVPYRMQSSMRKLHADLLSVGVPHDLLSQPNWLIDKNEVSIE